MVGIANVIRGVISHPASFPLASLSSVPLLRGGRIDRRALVLTILFTLSTTVLAAILQITGLVLQMGDFVGLALLAVLMVGLSAFCRARHDDLRLANAAAILGAATVSMLLCGLIANTGLRLGMPIADPRFAAADAALGIDMATIVRFTAATSWLSYVLEIAYTWSGAAVPVTIIAMLVFKQVTRGWELALTAVIAMQLVAIISVFFPAKGTAFFFELLHLQGNGIPAGAAVYAGETFDHFYYGTEKLVSLASLNGVVVFPSFHTVLALLITQTFWDTKFRWVAVLWTATVIVSTIPMGGHYGVDLAAGLLVWGASCKLATWATNHSLYKANSPSG